MTIEKVFEGSQVTATKEKLKKDGFIVIKLFEDEEYDEIYGFSLDWLRKILGIENKRNDSYATSIKQLTLSER